MASLVVSDGCLKARSKFEGVREHYHKLNQLIPRGQYYRYNDHWRFVTIRLSFLAALVVFLEVGLLVSRETVAQIIGREHHINSEFFLPMYD